MPERDEPLRVRPRLELVLRRGQEGLALHPEDATCAPAACALAAPSASAKIAETKTRQERIVPLLQPVADDLTAALPHSFSAWTTVLAAPRPRRTRPASEPECQR